MNSTAPAIPPAAADPAANTHAAAPPFDRPEQTEYVHPIAPWITPVITLIVAFALQQTIGRYFGSYIEQIAINAGIAVVMAVSLNIVNGYTGQFSIGHAAFFAIGGYTSGLISYYAAIELYNTSQVHTAVLTAIWVGGTIIGGLVAAAAGWMVGLPSLRLRGDYLAIVTLGFGEILRVLLQQTNTQLYSKQEIHDATASQLLPPPVGGSLGFINLPKTTTVFWVSLVVGLTLIVAWRLKRSTFGRAMIAIRENEIAAESMGVNVASLKVWAFVIAAFFAGVAGSLYINFEGTMVPKDAGFQASFDIVIMVVLGGLGSISGATLAAVLLTAANEWLRDPAQPLVFHGVTVHVWTIALVLGVLRLILWPHSRLKAGIFWLVLTGALAAAEIIAARYQVDFGDYRMIIYALVLIGMMILRPGGLFGTSEVTDLLRIRRQLISDAEQSR